VYYQLMIPVEACRQKGIDGLHISIVRYNCSE
jgi:hypothetical protein